MAQLTQVADTIAHQVARLPGSQGLLQHDTEPLELGEALDEEDSMPGLINRSITYRIRDGAHGEQ